MTSTIWKWNAAGGVALLCCSGMVALGASTSWTSAPPMLTARAAHAVVVADGAVYVLAGTGGDAQPVLDVERFDGRGWSQESRLPGHGLNAPAAAAIGHRIYLIGGFDTTTNVPTAQITDTANAQSAISAIDVAIDAINGQRANFGAVQNRFENVVSNMQVAVENQSAARSRIMDADYATETANLSRSQILQQAGTAMISQANQMPQQVLTLLRGG